MCRPIRALTEARGHEISLHDLSIFGGAGGQHACEIAENLGINRVVLHKHSSILSAYGMSLAEVVQEAQEPCVEKLSENSIPHINDRLVVLQQKVTSLLTQQDISPDLVEFESYLNLRYKGTDTALMVMQHGEEDFRDLFLKEHLREFGFVWQDDRPIIVDDIRVRGIGRACDTTNDVHALTNSLAKSLACSKFKSALGNAAMEKVLVYLVLNRWPCPLTDDRICISKEPGSYQLQYTYLVACRLILSSMALQSSWTRLKRLLFLLHQQPES